MSKPFIVIGDRTDHGGAVVASSAQTDIGGKRVARIGDPVSCPRCKGVFPIASGDATIIIDGRPVACHGHRTACGATLIAGQLQVVVGDGGGQGGAANPAVTVLAAGGAVAVFNGTQRYDEPIQYVNAGSANLGGVDHDVKRDARAGRRDGIVCGIDADE